MEIRVSNDIKIISKSNNSNSGAPREQQFSDVQDFLLDSEISLSSRLRTASRYLPELEHLQKEWINYPLKKERDSISVALPITKKLQEKLFGYAGQEDDYSFKSFSAVYEDGEWNINSHSNGAKNNHKNSNYDVYRGKERIEEVARVFSRYLRSIEGDG